MTCAGICTDTTSSISSITLLLLRPCAHPLPYIWRGQSAKKNAKRRANIRSKAAAAAATTDAAAATTTNAGTILSHVGLETKERILGALAAAQQPLTLLELSKAAGTAKDVNTHINALEREGKVEVVAKAMGNKLWSLVGRPADDTNELKIDRTDGNAYNLDSFTDVYGGSRIAPPHEWLAADRAPVSNSNEASTTLYNEASDAAVSTVKRGKKRCASCPSMPSPLCRHTVV